MKKLDIRWIKEHYSLTVATEGVLAEVYDNRVATMLSRETILEDIYDLIDYTINYYVECDHEMERLEDMLKRITTLKDAIKELEEAFF